jgi:hypothetical protein
MVYEHLRSRIAGKGGEVRRAVVLGAGAAARLLLAGLRAQGWVVLGLLDDDTGKQGQGALRKKPCRQPGCDQGSEEATHQQPAGQLHVHRWHPLQGDRLAQGRHDAAGQQIHR